MTQESEDSVEELPVVCQKKILKNQTDPLVWRILDLGMILMI